FDPAKPDSKVDAILIDIDHSTTHFIDPASASFYSPSSIAAVAGKLRPGGIFALWSTDEVEPSFLEAMQECLADVQADRVEFVTPYREEPAFNIVYLGKRS
ncbi:MAG: hypothetical protein P8J20_17145, partial [Novosphingobium sp.]|nr:hypothetical protein [Novosphingobium sp.]